MKKRLLAAALACVLLVGSTGCSSAGTSSAGTESKTGEESAAAESTGAESTATGTGTCEDTGCVWDAFTPYDETVTFTKGLSKGSDPNFPKGDNWENNDYTRFVKETVNVQPEIAWEVDANNYDQKVSLSISTGDIPDIMVVDRKILKQLVDNDLVWDMTDAYEKCISPTLKGYYDSFGDRLMREVSVGGRMMGIPGTQLKDQHNLFWVRKDWLKKLNMETPTTLDDIEAVAKAFIEKDPGGNGAGKTIGITGSEKVYGDYNSQHGLYSVFNAFDAYPKQWIEKDGKVVYGSVTEEMKPALEKLNAWYTEGILDKEFAVRKSTDREALISSGQCGIMFGPWWGWGGVPESVTNNPEADWAILSAPKDENGKLHVYTQDPINGILVVSKKFAHPEAIVKVLNSNYEISSSSTTEAGAAAYQELLETSPNMGWWVQPVALQVGPEDALTRGYRDYMDAVDAVDPTLIRNNTKGTYDTIMREKENPKADVFNWQEALIRTEGTGAAIDPDKIIQEVVYYGKTETMATKWANLEKLEIETMIKIIMGEKPLEEFDTFVSTWKQMGGDEITAEVQAEVDAR